LDRILAEQLEPLLISRHIYRQLSDSLKNYEGTDKSGELAVWMQEGCVAFAATRIRCMIEEPRRKSSWKSISVVILLEELKTNHAALTRERLRRMYRGRVRVAFADRDFDRIAREKGATCISSTRIERDIAAIKRAASPVKRLVDKQVAHTEEDRRRVGKCKYSDLDSAIDLLEETFRRYRGLIYGSYPSPLVSLRDYDVGDDLSKIWP
jgi:hypothetical protein